ncbi:MAG TPA: flavin reductase family protein [Micromonosporaceae bacterium]|nr:flavin reductase family protein [Micromonosporaceae bacterium]
MTIHATDPFATPDDAKSPVRRLRGRLPAAVTLWTVYDRERRPVGLTVSSTVVVEGNPARLLGVLDPESAVWEALEVGKAFAVMALDDRHRRLADRFAGLMPAPGGPFAGHTWTETEYGPVLPEAAAWAACRLAETRPVGWSQLVEAVIEGVDVAGETPSPPLVHWRGRYRTLE